MQCIFCKRASCDSCWHSTLNHFNVLEREHLKKKKIFKAIAYISIFQGVCKCIYILKEKGVCAIFAKHLAVWGSYTVKVHLLAKAIRCGSKHFLYCGSNLKLLPFSVHWNVQQIVIYLGSYGFCLFLFCFFAFLTQKSHCSAVNMFPNAFK